MVAAVGGIVSPIVVSSLIGAYPGSEGWRAVFLLTSAMSIATMLLWMKYQTSTVVIALNTPGDIIN